MESLKISTRYNFHHDNLEVFLKKSKTLILIVALPLTSVQIQIQNVSIYFVKSYQNYPFIPIWLELYKMTLILSK